MVEEDGRATAVAPWRAMLLAHSRALRAIEADLRAAGTIPLTWYDVLLELDAAPDGALRMSALADRVVLSRTRVSRLVGEVAARGLATRRADPDDGRAQLAAITPAGRQALREAAPAYLAGIEAHFTRHLSPTQRAAITEGLGAVAAAHGDDRGHPRAGSAPWADGPRRER